MMSRAEPNQLRFTCIGIPVKADETRSAAVCCNRNGDERIVIVARGYSLIINPDTGGCYQMPFPDGCRDYPFAGMSDNNGLFYTGAGSSLYVLDPFETSYIAQFEVPAGEECAGFAFAEDDAGMVYATTYPGSYLLKMDISTGECHVITQLDHVRKYAMSLAVGSGGWIYAGLGTTSPAIAAYRLKDGLLNVIHAEDDVPGSGKVHTGQDGNVYAWLPGATGQWYQLREGVAYEVVDDQVSLSVYRGEGYKKLHRDLSGGKSLLSWELSEGRVVIRKADGKIIEQTLDYEGSGTALSPLFGGPDGNLYGTSNHPLHFYRYEPLQARLNNYGAGMIEQGGGGNIAAYASQSSKIMGAAYAGGLIHVLDTAKEWVTTEGSSRNPKLIYANDAVHRPRCAVSLADGVHVIYGGFPGYGAVGGGLGIVNLDSEKVTMLGHDQVIPYQSTVSLAVMADGRIIGGSSIETPGGGSTLSKEAVLYEYDWSSCAVTRIWVPVPGAKEISHVAADDVGFVYGITSDGLFFVFDPSIGKVVSRQDLSSWGSVVRTGLIKTTYQEKPVILGLLSETLFTITPASMKPVPLAKLPKEATCGLAHIDGCVYYGSGAELWRFQWEEGKSS